jgi:MinD superfamily P-loop ATPase
MPLNFKKGGIFSRRGDSDYDEMPQQDSGGVLAVWGSPGSGKTLTAVKIAKALADKKHDTALLLCDMTAPMIPCICPPSEIEGEHSLEGVLCATTISENLIKNHCMTHKRNPHLTVLGLLKGENEYNCRSYTDKQATQLINGLRKITPYVVIDCSSYIACDILSATALMEADSVLRLANCDLKSVSYFSSQMQTLYVAGWDADKQYKVAANVKPDQAADHIGKVLGASAFRLPYSREVEEQYLAGTLLSDLTMKDSRAFRKEIGKIIGEVFDC